MTNLAWCEKETIMTKHLIDTLAGSKIYQDYERAFSETTGLPVALRSVESWQLPHHGKRFENPFCAMLSQKSRACAACLQVQQKLSETATHEAQTVTCQVGLCDIAVPVQMGEQLIGFLTTGQVFCKKPTEAQFNRAKKLLADWGVQTNENELRDAYFNTHVLSSRQHESVVKLLTIFAEHLSMVSNQIVMREQNAEPPSIARARQFITEHQTEDLSLEQVAKSVYMSKFHFCKLFKKATGINFTDYLSRARTERAKILLLNPNLRVGEIAYEVGFQSLTHFNRVFKRILGQSPTWYRRRLART
jgi:AraC-like DNA-binding protein/ligand-binding sensor protein